MHVGLVESFEKALQRSVARGGESDKAVIAERKIPFVDERFAVGRHAHMHLVRSDTLFVGERLGRVGIFEREAFRKLDRDLVFFGIRIAEVNIVLPGARGKSRFGASFKNVRLEEEPFTGPRGVTRYPDLESVDQGLFGIAYILDREALDLRCSEYVRFDEILQVLLLLGGGVTTVDVLHIGCPVSGVFDPSLALESPVLEQPELAGPRFARFFRIRHFHLLPDRFFWIRNQRYLAFLGPTQHTECREVTART